MAFLTNRLFDIKWLLPLDLGNFFEINSQLYQVSSKIYDDAVNSTRNSYKELGYVDSGNELNYYELTCRQIDKDAELIAADRLAISTNSLFGIVGLLHNKQLKSNLCRYLGDFDGYKAGPERFTSAVLVSAALRVIFSKPTERLRGEIDRVTGRQGPLWSSSTKIGVQIRMENPKVRIPIYF